MNEKELRPYGLQFDTFDPENYVFGSSSVPREVLQANGDWTDFIPTKEIQNLNDIEPYACVSYAILNCVEALIKRKYGIEVNYSDRFLAAISGTKIGGNKPHVVCEFLREVGVPLQDVWPFNENINTFEKYYAEIPQEIIDLAAEFRETWDFKHEFVVPTPVSISAALLCSPLLITMYAWVKRENSGLYYKPVGMIDTHAIMMFYERPSEFRRILDSYDSPHIKDIEWDSLPLVVKRFWIEKRVKKEKGLGQKILDAIIRYFKEIWR